jgi:Flp pilus assembly protein TadG
LLSRLWRSSRGAALPFIAFALMPMMAALGASVDIGRIYITRSQMQAGVNAAALAGANAYDNASETDENGRYKQAVNYYKDNMPNGYMGVTKPGNVVTYGNTTTLQKPVFSLSSKGISRTDVTASADLPMTFMALFKIPSYRIDVTAHAEFQPHPLEVMVVLDNTGSMIGEIGGVTKIASLKAAMHSFLNILYQGASTQPELAIGIINYTITANVGSILDTYGVQTQSMPGFTDRKWAQGDNLGWKGCVADDETINTMSSNMAVSEENAYDIWPSLPGEKPKPSSPRVMRPVKPYYYPPLYNGSVNGDNTNPFKPVGGVSDDTLYNLDIYKRYIYRWYSYLNNNGDPNDDVIMSTDMKTPYNVNAPGAYNDITDSGTAFYVRAAKIPGIFDAARWKPAVHYDINKYVVNQPTPNYQCPEPGLPVTYNVPKSTFDNYVDTRVWPVKPANGTMHHIGFLWGWRLLTRYEVFTRTKPAGSEAPTRALVFMTDGETALDFDDTSKNRIFTAYGAPGELQIATDAKQGSFFSAAKLRFAKACSIANSLKMPDSGKPPKIYTVAINSSSMDSNDKALLANCGTSGNWVTTSPSDLNAAFEQIARSLTDVHLVQ